MAQTQQDRPLFQREIDGLWIALSNAEQAAIAGLVSGGRAKRVDPGQRRKAHLAYLSPMVTIGRTVRVSV